MSKIKTSEITVGVVARTSRQITIPAGSVLEATATLGVFEIREPAHLDGMLVRWSGIEATADEATKTSEPTDSTDSAEHAKHVHRVRYRQQIDSVLNKIEDFENLPAIDAASFAHGIRDLGPVTDYVDAEIAASPKRLRAFLHHVNVEIPGMALSVDLASFPDRSKHFALSLNTHW